MLCKDSEEFSAKEYTSIKARFTLAGKKALVTGAAGGIGRTAAQAFAELGADVALIDIPAKKEVLDTIADKISSKFGVKAIGVEGDVSDEASVKAAIGRIVEKFGTIDVVFNNAGIIMRGDNANVELEKWNNMIAVNLTGILLVGREAANVMIQHKHGGSIINTASMSGHIINRTPTEEYGFSYTTTKAGVLHLTHGMAANYIKYGIRVNSISPGVVLSGIHDNIPVEYLGPMVKEVPIRRFGSLVEVADAVAFLATDMASFMVGSDILIDGGQCLN